MVVSPKKMCPANQLMADRLFQFGRDVLDKEESSSINGLMSAGKFHIVAKVNSIMDQ